MGWEWRWRGLWGRVGGGGSGGDGGGGFVPFLSRPDITVMVDWALKINYLSIYLSVFE